MYANGQTLVSEYIEHARGGISMLRENRNSIKSLDEVGEMGLNFMNSRVLIKYTVKCEWTVMRRKLKNRLNRKVAGSREN